MMSKARQDMNKRTKVFSLSIIRLISELPRDVIAGHISRQLLRAATSVGANYRAAGRGRSDAELFSKLCIVEEECDECIFWLELLGESGIRNQRELHEFIAEADSILRMVVSSKKTLRARLSSGTAVVREIETTYEIDFSDDLPSDLQPPEPTLDPRPSTLDPRPSTLNPHAPESTLDPRPSTLESANPQ